jgi:transcriptional regulator with XRE-family HTH domain
MAAKRHRLAQRRKAVGLSQEALAGVLEVERSTVVRWESGETYPLPWIRPRLAQPPREPGDVLGELCRAMGVPGTAIPSSTAERAALYRSLLAERRVLVLADDAATAAQVAPLLQGTSQRAVLAIFRQLQLDYYAERAFQALNAASDCQSATQAAR